MGLPLGSWVCCLGSPPEFVGSPLGFVDLLFHVVFVLISCLCCVFFVSLVVCRNLWIFFSKGEEEETRRRRRRRRRRRDSHFLISWFSFVELESLKLEFHVDFHKNRVFDTRVATVNSSLINSRY